MTKFYCPLSNDERLPYACQHLSNMGYIQVDSSKKADFILLGVNPTDFQKYDDKLVFAGNVCASNVFDYTKIEGFALKNAYLTSEGAISLAISNKDTSLINSNILIIGYGRIGKALHKMLTSFSPNVTVCARNELQRSKALLDGASITEFEKLKNNNSYDFVFNTVPHPVLNELELKALKKDTLIIDLASFPGGVDTHFAALMGINLIVARGLPAKYSPKSAGIIVADTIISMLEGRK